MKYTENEKRKMRIAVEKDVIKRIKLKKLKGKSGQYIEHKKLKSHMDFCNTPTQAETKCNVCAIGAAFLSFVRLYNNATEKLDSYYGTEMYDLLMTCFTEDQLRNIDNYFEDNRTIESDTDRILAIMQNAVDHKGDFKSNVEYEIISE